MARKMSKAATLAWRAVIVLRHPSGEESTEYRGPYWRKRDATTQVSSARNMWRGTWSAQFAGGWVESAPLGDWTREAQP